MIPKVSREFDLLQLLGILEFGHPPKKKNKRFLDAKTFVANEAVWNVQQGGIWNLQTEHMIQLIAPFEEIFQPPRIPKRPGPNGRVCPRTCPRRSCYM